MKESNYVKTSVLVTKCHVFILFLIRFFTNGKIKVVIQVIGLCSMLLMVWGNISLEYACVVYYLIIVISILDLKQDEIHRSFNMSSYIEAAPGGSAGWSSLLSMVYPLCFIWAFTFKEAFTFLAILPFAVCVLPFILHSITKFRSKINLGYKIREIYLKRICEELEPRAESSSLCGQIIKQIKAEINEHDVNGFYINL